MRLCVTGPHGRKNGNRVIEKNLERERLLGENKYVSHKKNSIRGE